MVNPRGGDHGHSGSSHSGGGAPSLRSAHSDGIEIFTPRTHTSSAVRVGEHDLADLVSRFRSLSTSSTDMVVRPGFGSRGAPITLRANMFQLNYPQDVTLYDYAIKVQPNPDSEEIDVRKHVVGLFEKSREMSPFQQGIALDGSHRLVAKAPLPNGLSVKVAVRLNEGGRPSDKPYTVTLAGPRQLKSADLAR